jgi:hypothetical protein
MTYICSCVCVCACVCRALFSVYSQLARSVHAQADALDRIEGLQPRVEYDAASDTVRVFSSQVCVCVCVYASICLNMRLRVCIMHVCVCVCVCV